MTINAWWQDHVTELGAEPFRDDRQWLFLNAAAVVPVEDMQRAGITASELESWIRDMDTEWPWEEGFRLKEVTITCQEGNANILITLSETGCRADAYYDSERRIG